MEAKNLQYKIMTGDMESLSDVEIMSMLVDNRRTKAIDKARFFIDNENGLANMDRITGSALVRRYGFSKAEAVRLIASLELSRRKNAAIARRSFLQFKSPKDVYSYMAPLFEDKLIEQFFAITIRRNNTIISAHKISSGGLSGTATDIRVIMKKCIDDSACGFVCAHNHPSGNKNPSQSDINITNKIVEAGRIMDIPLVDHIIITATSFYSFADNGLI